MLGFVEEEEICYEPIIKVPQVTATFEYKKNVRNVRNVSNVRNVPPIDKKPPTKELDEKKLTGRQKQIDYGRNTIGYERYLARVPK